MLVPPNAGGGGSSSGSSVGGPSQQGRRHRRLSSLNTVSWPNANELTVSPRARRMSTVASSDADAQENNVNSLADETEVPHLMLQYIQENEEKSIASPRAAKSSRRKSSFSTSIAQEDITLDPMTSRRRSSYIPSWAIDDDDEGLTTTRNGRRRKYSWGPAGELGFRDSIRSASSRSPVSHHECKLDFQLAHEINALFIALRFVSF